MDIRRITDAYAVSPQIAPEDLPAIAAAGFRTVLCNRPDEEVPPALSAAAVGAAVKAAGLDFVVHPLVHPQMEALVPRQMEVLAAADGPVLAYCASGTRCSVAWSIGQAGRMPVDDILAATAAAGYDLSGLRNRLEQG